MLADVNKLDASPRGVTPTGESFGDPAWAPVADADVLALGRINADGDRDLCFGELTRDGLTPDCITDPELTVGGAFHWSPNGKTIYGYGITNPASEDGVVRWRSERAFSTDASDWTGGKFVNEDARDAALSPDGKTLAVVAHTAEDKPYELYFTKPGNIELTNAKSTIGRRRRGQRDVHRGRRLAYQPVRGQPEAATAAQGQRRQPGVPPVRARGLAGRCCAPPAGASSSAARAGVGHVVRRWAARRRRSSSCSRT
jgi:hypothetical protein